MCLLYYFNTEAVLFACLSLGWATTTVRLLSPLKAPAEWTPEQKQSLSTIYATFCNVIFYFPRSCEMAIMLGILVHFISSRFFPCFARLSFYRFWNATSMKFYVIKACSMLLWQEILIFTGGVGSRNPDLKCNWFEITRDCS